MSEQRPALPQRVPGSYLTGVNLGLLRAAIQADLAATYALTGLIESDISTGALVASCQWPHVTELVRQLLTDKAIEAVEQLGGAMHAQLTEVMRLYIAAEADRAAAPDPPARATL